MTIGYVEAVYQLKTEMSATQCAVLAALAAMAGEDGCCWYRQAYLAGRVRLHPHTVKTTLRELAGLGLIAKDVKTAPDGGVVATAIRLCFEAVEFGRPPGVEDSPPGVLATPPSGAKDTGLNRKKTKGGLPPTPQADIESVWAITPLASRQHSTSKAEVGAALHAAYVRGHKLDEILGGLRGYFTSREATREDGRWVKGVHRMIENDRWVAFSAKAEVHRIAEADPWPARLRMWVANGWWEDLNWGPAPDDPKGGCKAPPEQVDSALAARRAERAERLARKQTQAVELQQQGGQHAV